MHELNCIVTRLESDAVSGPPPSVRGKNTLDIDEDWDSDHDDIMTEVSRGGAFPSQADALARSEVLLRSGAYSSRSRTVPSPNRSLQLMQRGS